MKSPVVKLSPYELAVNRLNDLPPNLDKIFSEALEDLRKQRDEAQKNYQWMVDRACDEKLDGYRELANRAANAENERDEAIALLRRLVTGWNEVEKTFRAIPISQDFADALFQAKAMIEK